MFVDVDIAGIERPAQRMLETLETEVFTTEPASFNDQLRLDGELDPHSAQTTDSQLAWHVGPML